MKSFLNQFREILIQNIHEKSEKQNNTHMNDCLCQKKKIPISFKV
jgi:hypothetical protein